MEVKYSENYRHAYYGGYKFRRDPKTGYYLSTKKIAGFGRRMRLHVVVWTQERGEIPEGFQVHHIDGDKSNNDIENFQLLTKKEHASWHGNHPTEETREKRKNNMLNKAVPAAIKWHKSKEGHEWHIKHYETMGDKLHERTEHVCAECGKKFMGIPHQRFCSNNCKSSWRRHQHIDDEERTCLICGGKFYANKYSETKTCCTACRSQFRKEIKRKRASI